MEPASRTRRDGVDYSWYKKFAEELDDELAAADDEYEGSCFFRVMKQKFDEYKFFQFPQMHYSEMLTANQILIRLKMVWARTAFWLTFSALLDIFRHCKQEMWI